MDSKKFIKKILGFSLVSWISFAVSFITIPITTRIYSPDQLGHINIFATVANLCLFIVLFGLDQAFIRFYNEPPNGSLKKLFNNCMFFVGISFVIFAFVIIIIGKYISIEISGSYQPTIVILLLVNVFSMIVLRFSSVIYRMDQKVVAYSIQALLIVLSNRIIYVISGLVQPNYVTALVLMNISLLVIAVVYLLLQSKLYSIHKYNIDYNSTKTLFKYALPLMPITIISWVNSSVSLMIMRHYLNFSAIGIYSSGLAIASLIGIVGAGFSIFWIPYVYANYKTDNDKIQSVHRYITFILVFVGISIILFQDVIFLLIGSAYLPSKVFFSFLIIAPICTIMSDTTGLGIDISKKSYLHLITTSLSAGGNLFFCLILLPIMGYAGVALASAIAGILLLISRTIIGERYYKCVNNYTSSIIALVLLIIAATVSFIFAGLIVVRLVVSITLIVILFVLYRKEFVRLVSDGKNILLEYRTKSK